MINFLKILTINSGIEVRDLLVDRVQCPLLTFNRICFGYLNNDLLMVFSGIVTLALSVTFLFIQLQKEARVT
jgi:hypothetical protein